MSAFTFDRLLQLTFGPNNTELLTPAAYSAYDEFEAAQPAEQPFRFERVRLLVAMSLLKALSDLGGPDDSHQVLLVLQRALQARSTDEIDAIITKDAQRFEKLYTNLYVNDEGGQLLELFEETLSADTEPAMSHVIDDAAELISTLDFDAAHDEDEE
ncbi:hypothetical protein F0P96_05440 [Hymenobacter busanensis]|uniref:Uncharacterized protein n=1 Tax=Hymenobacter busanensis TaxID=2607656 RepID=A0A7L5A0I8_9BACT|nr:hypothetical protein [Hymenobacter busanensis]KAA9338282.1 hypothetical protein F0P96_05440 [Hymenobacter busanensis]QHJ09294.1 hypothetical protein GUY19_19170 [Hymenobacter busanensis]